MQTLSENWHTVAALRPRLHEAATVTRQPARGRLWHVVHHPAGEGSRRLTRAAWAFVARLDGRATVDGAWHAALAEHGDEALTQPEVIELLGWLAPANLLRFDRDADAANVLRHAADARLARRKAAAMNPLFLRVRLGCPDHAVDALAPLARLLFGKAGLAAATLLVAAGAVVAWRHGADLLADVAGASATAAVWAAALLLACKLLHEAAHALAAKVLGGPHGCGEVRALGLMWLIVAPVPFVDVTASAGIPNKWARATVAAAGIVADLCVAALLVIAWTQLAPGYLRSAAAVTAALLVGGSLLFNANPLVKFDGYFVLSDALELPGLARRSFAYAGYVAKRRLFGLAAAANPSHAPSERPWLLAYAVAAAAYRLVLCLAIVKLLTLWWPVAAAVLGSLTVFGMLVLPTWRAVRYVLTSPELSRRRARAVGVSGGLVAAAAVVLGAVPLTEYVSAEAVATAQRPGTLYPPTSAEVVAVLDDGATVEAGAVLVRLRDDALTAELAEARARLAQATLRRRATVTSDPAASAGFADDERVQGRRVTELEDRLRRLTVTADRAGVFVRPAVVVGQHVRPGEAVGRVVAAGELSAVAEVGEQVGPRLTVGGAAELRDAGGTVTEGVVEAVTPGDEAGRFVVRVRPAGDAVLRDGGGLDVSFDLGRRPLAWQWLGALRRTLAPRRDVS